MVCISFATQSICELLGQPVVIHLDQSTCKRVSFHYHGLNAAHLGSVQDFKVCDPALPMNIHDGLQSCHVKLLQLLQGSFVHSPQLTSTEAAGENDGPVYTFIFVDNWMLSVVIQDVSVEPTESSTGLADPGTDPLIQAAINTDGAAEVIKDTQDKISLKVIVFLKIKYKDRPIFYLLYIENSKLISFLVFKI